MWSDRFSNVFKSGILKNNPMRFKTGFEAQLPMRYYINRFIFIIFHDHMDLNGDDVRRILHELFRETRRLM